MKINRSNPSEPINRNEQAIRISTLPSGTTSVQQAVSNYNSASQDYQKMNQVIVGLDTQFESLPA